MREKANGESICRLEDLLDVFFSEKELSSARVGQKKNQVKKEPMLLTPSQIENFEITT